MEYRMTTSDDAVRYAPGSITADGDYIFSWHLTSCQRKDPVILEIPPEEALPVIFVPGIMGSNLRSNDNNGAQKEAVWRLDNSSLWNWVPIAKDKPIDLLKEMITALAGDRQQSLHPEKVDVDPGGATPRQAGGSVYDPEQYGERGWGEIGEGSYHGFLLWLEQTLNGQGYNPATWPEFHYPAMSAAPAPGQKPCVPRLPPGIRMSLRGLPDKCDAGPLELYSDDLLARAGYRMPVYACGYNWLDSNLAAAERLRQRILTIIQANNHRHSRCSRVVLITHSMGGLVARACQQLAGMREAIAGIVHGVMPGVGAAVAYRRCKIGMWDEGGVPAKAASQVIGRTGQETTAVFAQAPGALQLLPTRQYRPGWLTIAGPCGKALKTEPRSGDPYKDIYLREDRWWGLIRKEWLNPPNGSGLDWEQYTKNLGKAAKFHDGLQDDYHPNTYIFYGNAPNLHLLRQRPEGQQLRRRALAESTRPAARRRALANGRSGQPDELCAGARRRQQPPVRRWQGAHRARADAPRRHAKQPLGAGMRQSGQRRRRHRAHQLRRLCAAQRRCGDPASAGHSHHRA
ncbi:hypothetical protein [Pandoraea sp.]|uniref:esterase/lipase family protein n=1 Tax=Pandoraea sp. TaxID=1883445 RepID=UPI0025FF84E8|nr:hypothetical protein [Pandoraea sp.]